MTISVLFRQAIAVIGSSLLGIGVFLPMLGVAIFRDHSYYSLSPGGATILIVLAGLSILLAVTKRFQWLYVTGIFALGLVIYTLIAMNNRQSAIQSDLKEHVADMPLKSLSQNLVSSVRLRIGWPMMFAGALLILSVPLIGSRVSRRKREPEPPA